MDVELWARTFDGTLTLGLRVSTRCVMAVHLAPWTVTAEVVRHARIRVWEWVL